MAEAAEYPWDLVIYIQSLLAEKKKFIRKYFTRKDRVILGRIILTNQSKYYILTEYNRLGNMYQNSKAKEKKSGSTILSRPSCRKSSHI